MGEQIAATIEIIKEKKGIPTVIKLGDYRYILEPISQRTKLDSTPKKKKAELEKKGQR